MKVKCSYCNGKGYKVGDISKSILPCIFCKSKGWINRVRYDNTIYRITDGFEIRAGFYNQLCDLDKRMWTFLPDTNSKPLLIETSLCNLFNSYFGFNLLRHPVNTLHDLEGYYV